MPVSSTIQISDCLERIVPLAPESVLDIGCGFGLWGFLCREYLDVWNGRVQPEDWKIRIDGVELWEPYIQAHQRALYNEIHIGDVREVVSTLDEYDLVIAGDVIEHLDKPDALKVTQQLYALAKRAMLINIPLTGNWDHPEQHGNPGELHRSQWTEADFDAYPAIYREYRLPCGEYGSFFCVKEDELENVTGGLIQIAQQRCDRNDLPGALTAARDAHRLMPNEPATILSLVEVLLRNERRKEAIQTLDDVLNAQPDFHLARFTLTQLLRQQQEHDRANRELQILLNAEDLPNNLRIQVEQWAGETV